MKRLFLILIVFSFPAEGFASSRCERVYSSEPFLKAKYYCKLVEQARNQSCESFVKGSNNGVSGEDYTDCLSIQAGLQAKGSDATAENSENTKIPYQQIFSLAVQAKCEVFKVEKNSENKNLYFYSICNAVNHGLNGKSCSELKREKFPEIAKVSQAEWAAAVIGSCRGVELTGPTSNSAPSIQDSKQSQNSSRNEFESNLEENIPASLKVLIRTKKEDGGVSYFESMLFALSLHDYTPSNFSPTALEDFQQRGMKLLTQAYFPEVTIDAIEFLPTSNAHSDDQSYFVAIRRNSNLEKIAFMKVFVQESRFTSFIETFLAEKIIKSLNLKKSIFSEIIGYGLVRFSENKILIMHIEKLVPGNTIEGLISEVEKEEDPKVKAEKISSLKNAVKGVAVALSELHSENFGGSVSKVRERNYQVSLEAWTKYIIKKTIMSSKFSYSGFTQSQVIDFGQSLIPACLNDVNKVSAPILGDPTCNNIIYHPETDTVAFIDIPGLSSSLNYLNQPHGEATWDLATFSVNLRHSLFVHQFSETDVEEMEKIFRDHYRPSKVSYDFNNPCFSLYSWTWRMLRPWVSFVQIDDKDVAQDIKDKNIKSIYGQLDEIKEIMESTRNLP